MEPHTGKATFNGKFTEGKDRVERKHNNDAAAETTKTWENANLQKHCFEHHNKKTEAEYCVEK